MRLAVLGCGEVARDHHLPWLARIPNAVVAVIADADPAAIAAASELAPGATVAADWRDALTTPGLDGALVCLPNSLHAPAAEAAAELGLHVYIEKPLATTLADADRVLGTCERAGVIGMMGFNYRFNALYMEARALLEAERVGTVAFCRGAFMLARADVPPWKRSSSSGGGVLLDLAPHHVDLVPWLLEDDVVDVVAAVSSRASELDTATLSLRLRSGVVAQLAFAYGVVDEMRLDVYGDRGRLVVDRRRHQQAYVEPAGEGRLRQLARAAQDAARLRYILEKRAAPGGEPSHGAALRRFVAAVLASEPVQPDLAAGRRSAAVIDAAERSARSGAWERPAEPHLAETRAAS